MKQSKAKPILSEKERQKQAVLMTYSNHQKQIDAAIEIALQNIHWIGLPDDFLSKVEGTKLIYPKDINHIHLRIGVREVTKNPENRLFGWFVTGFILNKHTNKLVMQSRWTRRDLQHVKILSQAMLFGTGKGDLQYEIKSNVLQGYKPCSDEDVEIINLVWEEKMDAFNGDSFLAKLTDAVQKAEEAGFVADCVVENSIDGTSLPQDIQNFIEEVKQTGAYTEET
jgi:hypothetical protein